MGSCDGKENERELWFEHRTIIRRGVTCKKIP